MFFFCTYVLTCEQARSVRQRAVNRENDENAAPARMTRAKTAASGGQDELSEGIVKKALQSKKSTTNVAPAQRKRPALGDLSNIGKTEPTEGKVAKKPTGRPALASKTSNAGVQNATRTSSSSRSALRPKDANTKKSSSSDLKRPASGAGTVGRATKKRATGSSASQPIEVEPTVEPKVEQPKEEISVKVEKRETIEIREEIQESIKEETEQASKHGATPQSAPDGFIFDRHGNLVPDLDADDFDDPIMVAEYAVEIFDYLRQLEQTTLPNPDYMEHQAHIDWNDRDVLNDWLVQVHQRFQLLPETFYLAINIIDRFLSTKVVQLDKLQLVGITALFIASKYEEVISPHVSNFTYMSKDYSDNEILSAERFILAALNYDLSFPNPMNFLRRISKADNYEMQVRTIGKYLLEICHLDRRFMGYCPSHLAATSMYFARMIMNRGDWVS